MLDYIWPLLENIVTIIGIAAAGSYIGAKLPRLAWLAWGVLFGLGTVILMRDSLLMAPGRFVDFRFLTMTLAGYFGGPLPALLAAGLSGLYRWELGGAGAVGGVTSIFAFGLVGVYLRRFRLSNWSPGRHLLLGLALTALVLIIIPLVPPWETAALEVAKKTALPFFLLAPACWYIGFSIFAILQEVVSSQQLLREEIRLLDIEPEPAIIREPDGTIIFWNRKAEELYGWTKDEAVGKCGHELLATSLPLPLEEINAALERNGHWEGEVVHSRKDGSRITCRSCWLVKRTPGKQEILELNMDITRTKKLEAELRRLEVLTAVGEMAAGISHEVRNPLTTVRGYLQLFQHKEAFSDQREQFATMINELDRANTIISEFLSLARDRVSELKVGNLNTIIQALFPLIQADAFHKGHEVRLETGAIPNIRIDESEIRQLVLNLTRNGLEAMDAGGRLMIATCREGETVVLKVTDGGRGIPEEVLAHLGTPFVTTKANGTGLGLSVCYRIAQNHGAKIEVETSPAGTTFSVIFKAA